MSQRQLTSRRLSCYTIKSKHVKSLKCFQPNDESLATATQSLCKARPLRYFATHAINAASVPHPNKLRLLHASDWHQSILSMTFTMVVPLVYQYLWSESLVALLEQRLRTSLPNVRGSRILSPDNNMRRSIITAKSISILIRSMTYYTHCLHNEAMTNQMRVC